VTDHIYIDRNEWLQTVEELAHLRADNERLTNALADADDQIKEQEAHIESLQNTVAQVTAENVALGEYVDADREAQNEIKRLEAENKRLLEDAIDENERLVRREGDENAKKLKW